MASRPSKRRSRFLLPLYVAACLLAIGLLLFLATTDAPPASVPASGSYTIPLDQGNRAISKPSDLQGSALGTNAYSPQSALPLRPDQLENISL